MIAATWQFTIVASLFVLKGFGRPVPGPMGIAGLLLIMAGLTCFALVRDS